MFRDLRWGVYVVLKAPNDYAARLLHANTACKTDASGRYAAMYKPYHLIGLELGISVLSAALRGEPTGQPQGWRGDVVAVAKRALRAGETLDGEGGYTVWGKLVPAARSLAEGALPIGLAHNVAAGARRRGRRDRALGRCRDPGQRGGHGAARDGTALSPPPRRPSPRNREAPSEYRPFGRTGLNISAIGFGCWKTGGTYWPVTVR